MRESRGDRLFKVFTIFIVIVITATCLFPFLYIVSVSFSNKTSVMRSEVFLWPVNFDLSAYKSVFGNRSLMTSMWFTIGLTVVHTVICVVMTVLCAYPLSKPELKWKTPILLYILFSISHCRCRPSRSSIYQDQRRTEIVPRHRPSFRI